MAAIAVSAAEGGWGMRRRRLLGCGLAVVGLVVLGLGAARLLLPPIFFAPGPRYTAADLARQPEAQLAPPQARPLATRGGTYGPSRSFHPPSFRLQIYGTRAGADEVVAWYRQGLARRGWQENGPFPETSLNTDDAAQLLAWRKGDLGLQLKVFRDGSDELALYRQPDLGTYIAVYIFEVWPR